MFEDFKNQDLNFGFLFIILGSSSFLINTVDCGSSKKTSDFCAQVAETCIEKCKTNYDKNVFALVTDNEKKMVKVREILKEKFPDLVTYGCSAHYLNLVETDVTPRTVLAQVVEVQKFFRNHHQPHGWLKEKGGRMPQIPNTTRWNSQNDCVKTFVENFHLYLQISAEHSENIDSRIVRILNNVSIYR